MAALGRSLGKAIRGHASFLGEVALCLPHGFAQNYSFPIFRICKFVDELDGLLAYTTH